MTATLLVTGASGGIGTAVADALVAAGYDVVGTDRSSSRHVLANGVADLTDATQRRALVGTIDGRLDGVVFAHGIEGTGAVATLDEEHLRRVLAVNFTAVVELYSELDDQLTADAAVVAIASQAGLRGEPASAAYCAAKFALVSWFRSLEPPVGRRLRLLCPGAVDTSLVRAAFAGMAVANGTTVGDVERQRLLRVPAGRLGRTAEVAAAVLFAMRASAPRLELAPTGGETLA